MSAIAFWLIFGLGVYALAWLLVFAFAIWDMIFGGSEDEWCEGCGDPATQHDLDGVPLCDECAQPGAADEVTECPCCNGTMAKHSNFCTKRIIDSGEDKR